MANKNLPRFFVIILLGSFGYFIFDDVVPGNQKEEFNVIAYSNNSLKDYFANINVNDSEFVKGYVITNGYKVFVDIAITDKQLQDGLAIKNSLKENEGMLFFLGEPRKASFWMKDMKFNLDIYWFDESKQLIHQEQNLSPDSYPRNFCPAGNTKYVLEMTAGSAIQLGQVSSFEFTNQ